MKTVSKYFLTLSMVLMMGITFAQDRDRGSIDDPVVQAQMELIELKGMDKDAMTKSEKKAWKRKKRALASYINSEQERMMREKNPFWHLSPYNRYSPLYSGYSYSSRYWNRPIRYSRPVVVVRSGDNCTYPRSPRRN